MEPVVISSGKIVNLQPPVRDISLDGKEVVSVSYSYDKFPEGTISQYFMPGDDETWADAERQAAAFHASLAELQAAGGIINSAVRQELVDKACA